MHITKNSTTARIQLFRLEPGNKRQTFHSEPIQTFKQIRTSSCAPSNASPMDKTAQRPGDPDPLACSANPQRTSQKARPKDKPGHTQRIKVGPFSLSAPITTGISPALKINLPSGFWNL